MSAVGLGQQRSEAVGPGSNPSFNLHFSNFIKKFRDQNFSETQMGSTTKVFGTVRQKKFDKIVIPLLSKKNSTPEHF